MIQKKKRAAKVRMEEIYRKCAHMSTGVEKRMWSQEREHSSRGKYWNLRVG